jgi:hypothetical protein
MIKATPRFFANYDCTELECFWMKSLEFSDVREMSMIPESVGSKITVFWCEVTIGCNSIEN